MVVGEEVVVAMVVGAEVVGAAVVGSGVLGSPVWGVQRCEYCMCVGGMRTRSHIYRIARNVRGTYISWNGL